MIIDINCENIKKYNHGDIIICHANDFGEEFDEFFLYIETEIPHDKFFFDLENGNVLSTINEESIISVIPFEDIIITREES